MSDVIDWPLAEIAWTDDGFELSMPLAPAVSARQVKIIADAVERAVHAACGTTIEVGFVEPDGDGSAAELLVTSADLLGVDPNLLRDTAAVAANTAANEAIGVEERETQAMAGWLHALRSGRH